jgi:hypothetical protein
MAAESPVKNCGGCLRVISVNVYPLYVIEVRDIVQSFATARWEHRLRALHRSENYPVAESSRIEFSTLDARSQPRAVPRGSAPGRWIRSYVRL